MATQIDDKYKSPYEDHEWQEGYGVWESGFERGMQWMLEKAMALIEDSVVFDKFGRPVKSETFRKALEE